ARTAGAMIGVDVLTQKRDFAHPAIGERVRFSHDVAHGTRVLRPACIGDDAEGAELVAALLNRKERRYPVGGPRGQGVEFFLRREIGFQTRPTLPRHTRDELWKFVIGLRTNHQIDLWRALADLLAFGLRHAAGDGDHRRLAFAGATELVAAQAT